MSPKDFGPQKPGELVKTIFDEPDRQGKVGAHRRVQGWAFVPNDLPPALDRTTLRDGIFDDLLAAEAGLARLEGAAEDLPNARLLWAPLSRREAILSSKIEDTVASAEEVVLVEAGEKPAREEVQEVANYVKALSHGLKSKLPVCLRLIKEMHEILLGGPVRGASLRPGQFRDIQNYIGKELLGFEKARFVPPPPGEPLDRCMRAFERFVNSDSRHELRPLVAIAMAHYQFECIHPFRDGNGRIGRLIAALSICHSGLLSRPFVYVSGYFEAHREEYYRLLLAVSTEGAWIDWVRFFLKAVANQSADALDRISRLRAVRKRYREALIEANVPAKAAHLADKLLERPVVTVSAVAKFLGVTKPTARSYIHRLADVGALRELSNGYRRKWMAQEVVDIING